MRCARRSGGTAPRSGDSRRRTDHLILSAVESRLVRGIGQPRDFRICGGPTLQVSSICFAFHPDLAGPGMQKSRLLVAYQNTGKARLSITNVKEYLKLAQACGYLFYFLFIFAACFACSCCSV